VGKALLAFNPEAAMKALAMPLAARTPYTITSHQVLAEELTRIRQTGLSYDREENSIGIVCVAAPILIDDRAIGAVSITCSPPRTDVERYAPAVKAAALGIRRTIARTPGLRPSDSTRGDVSIMTDTTSSRPEIGRRVDANGIGTNYLEAGEGTPVVLVHGSGPGVSAYANWRLTIPDLATEHRVLAPDMAGFGFSDKPGNYSMEGWVQQLDGVPHGAAARQGVAGRQQLRRRLGTGLRGTVARARRQAGADGFGGGHLPDHRRVSTVCGDTRPSIENMRSVLDFFAFDRTLVNDELAELRHRASIEPGMQEAFSAMFPAPRQRWVESMTTPLEQIAALPHETLIIHGRDDRVIPLDNACGCCT
jgi:2-hydroxymuconate-semialdehyde hydrolase